MGRRAVLVSRAGRPRRLGLRALGRHDEATSAVVRARFGAKAQGASNSRCRALLLKLRFREKAPTATRLGLLVGLRYRGLKRMVTLWATIQREHYLSVACARIGHCPLGMVGRFARAVARSFAMAPLVRVFNAFGLTRCKSW